MSGKTLSNAVAVVTGGAVRLGRAMSEALGDAGARVVIHYNSSAAPAEETAAALSQRGVESRIVQADLTRPVEAASRVFDAAETEFGGATILINNAAIFEESSLLTTTEDVWDRHHTINLKAPFFFSQEFVRRLSSDQEGHIINLADWRGLRPPGGYAAYTPTKAGLISMTRNLAQELGPQVRVNAIAPGAILPGPGESGERFRQRELDTPLRRTGAPHDIVAAMMYLLHSEFVTGEVMVVSGGEQL